MFIKERWNGGFKRFAELYFIVKFDIKGFLQGVGNRNVRLIQIPCIYCVNRFTRFERWEKKIQVICHKFQLKTIRFMQFSHKITTMTRGYNDLVRSPNSVTQLGHIFFLFVALDSRSSHKNITRF